MIQNTVFVVVIYRPQMGSEYKSKLLVEQMREIFKRWLADVRERRRKQEQCVRSPQISLSLEWSPRLSSVTSSAEALASMRNKSYRGDIVEEEEERKLALSSTSLKHLSRDTKGEISVAMQY